MLDSNFADVAKLANASDLSSDGQSLQVRFLSSVPTRESRPTGRVSSLRNYAVWVRIPPFVPQETIISNYIIVSIREKIGCTPNANVS